MVEMPTPPRESLIFEAQAQIIWGHPPEKVHDWLVSKGLDSMEADEIVRACLVDRTAQLRRRALIEIFIGSAVCLMSGIIVVGMLIGKIVVATLLIIVVPASLYGVYRLFRGIGLLLAGARYRGSVTEIGEGWFEGWFKE